MGVKGRLAVFARAPVFGAVKRRLALSVGENAALDCYRKLLDNAVEAVMPFESEIFVYRSTSLVLFFLRL